MSISYKEFQAKERIRKANEKWINDKQYKPKENKNKRKTWISRKYEIDEDFNELHGQVYLNELD